ncbi:MAG: hypothetical protein C0622_13970 [Desulfuromonas sp.]|nr:MAG: hypothetical protein C0622_13970 [Desulfuromonas sp.]
MKTADFFRVIDLEQGIRLEFRDLTNRYFGDYHRTVVNVRALIPCNPEALTEDQKQFLTAAGDRLCYETNLVQMAVPTAELVDVRAALIDSFLETTAHYLAKPGFVSGLLKKQMAERRNKRHKLFHPA